MAVGRRVVLVVPRRGEKDAGGSFLSLRGAIFAHDPYHKGAPHPLHNKRYPETRDRITWG